MNAPASSLLTVRGLRVGYRSSGGLVPLIHGVDFHVAAGETVGLVGESGSGKSVTGRAIMGLLDSRFMVVDADELTLGGEPIIRKGGRPTRNAAMIFQNPFTSLNPSFTVGNFLREVIRRRHGIRGAAARRRAVELLDAVKLPDPVRKLSCYPHQLSGGQQQRVVIAVALALQPSLLIADEPTTALDVTVQAEIIGLLHELQREHAMALVFISHDLALISDIASRVLVMYRGRIVESGGREIMTGAAAHPYTRALLAASPSVHRRKSRAELAASYWPGDETEVA